MSEKKAKEHRKNNAQKVAEISIIAYNDGRMEVKHPQDLSATINMLLDTIRLMYKQIIQVQGEPSKIITLNPGSIISKKDLS